MQPLHLPPYPFRIREKEGKQEIFDVLRNRFVRLTPEEWVRQHFVHFLIQERNYPQGLLGNELQIELNRTRRRCDTVVFDTQRQPRVIVEYKAPHIPITQEVIHQITRYNMVLKVDYLIVSNGMNHYCCKVDYEHDTYVFLRDIPYYKEVVRL